VPHANYSSVSCSLTVFSIPADHFENQYHDECDRNVDLEEALLDAQSTIGQFRDLVLSMQTCVSRAASARRPATDTLLL
jgi:hypothetical protein